MDEEIVLSQGFRFVLEKDHRVVDSLWEAYEAIVASPVLKSQLALALQEAKRWADNRLTLQQLASNEKIGTIFSEIQQQHTGKVIYIDCWATWCRPCIAEFPNSVKLKDQFEEVAFVYLCLGNNRSSWQQLIDKYKLGGSHYYLSDQQQAELQSVLRISGVPRYVIVNRAGVLIDEDADRPGADHTKKRLTTLLQE